MARTALVAGATGLVGKSVVAQLVADARWSRVIVLTRRPVDGAKASDKIEERVVDFEALCARADRGERFEENIDDVFACLGTTIKVAGSQARFRRVDHDYTVAVARLGKNAGANALGLVSSVGAVVTGGNFYLRVKGETERDVGELGYETAIVARPSFLVGNRDQRRPGERVGIAIASVVAPLMVGGLRVYRPIPAHDVAHGLVERVGSENDGKKGMRVLLHAELVA